jgi:uncharacterized protein (TIGR02145 family)
VYGSNYPPVGEYLSSTKISFTGTPMYNIVLKDNGSGTDMRMSGSPFSVPQGYTVQSFTDKTGAPGIIKYIPKTEGGGVFQPQGSCTYIEPAVVGTFANFDPNYSAATYVSLTDERDNKNYPVLKMGDRWIMARNLNYQEGLTWQSDSKQPSTTSGQDLGLIGSFWCPGSGGTSTRAACDVYGVLYSWETAMLLDGYGTWTEVAIYSTGAVNTDNAKFNQGRTAHSGTGTGGRGICPPNWHVPTDYEWAVFYDAVEGGGTVHQTAPLNSWSGTVVGKYSKSACNGSPTATAPLWVDSTEGGTDSYGFRALPAGYRTIYAHSYYDYGYYSLFWTSTLLSETTAISTGFARGSDQATRMRDGRPLGYLIRCINDQWNIDY